MGSGDMLLGPENRAALEKLRQQNKIIEKTGGYTTTEFAARAKALEAEDATYKAGMEKLFGTKIPAEQWKAMKDGADKRLDDFRQSERKEIMQYENAEHTRIFTNFMEKANSVRDPETGLAKDKEAMKKFVEERQAKESKLESEVEARHANLRDVNYMMPKFCGFIAEEAIKQTGVTPDKTVAQLGSEIREIRANANATYKETFVVAKKTFDVAVAEK